VTIKRQRTRRATKVTRAIRGPARNRRRPPARVPRRHRSRAPSAVVHAPRIRQNRAPSACRLLASTRVEAGACALELASAPCEPAVQPRCPRVAALPLVRPPDAWLRGGWCSSGAATAGPTARSLSPRVGPRAHDRNGDIPVVPIRRGRRCGALSDSPSRNRASALPRTHSSARVGSDDRLARQASVRWDENAASRFTNHRVLCGRAEPKSGLPLLDGGGPKQKL
jgi:hypothetical protein